MRKLCSFVRISCSLEVKCLITFIRPGHLNPADRDKGKSIAVTVLFFHITYSLVALFLSFK